MRWCYWRSNFIAAVGVLTVSGSVLAAENNVRVTSGNSSRFETLAIPGTRIQAACYLSVRGTARFGLIRGGVFRDIDPQRPASRFEKKHRALLAAAQRRCRRKVQPTPTPLPTQPPVSDPTPVPTQPPSVTPTPLPVTPTPVPPSGFTPVAIPSLSQWQSRMVTVGAQHCANLASSSFSFDQKLAATYYDAQWVFYQIADYTGDSSWNTCAARAEAVYRDQYVVPNNGNVPGYWNFSHGLMHDFLRTGDVASKNAAISLSRNAAYSPDATPLAWTVSAEYSREVAYAIMGYLNAETLGEAHRARLDSFVNQAFGHLDQWFGSRTAPYVRPFMVGLTAHALISHADQRGDSRVLPALVQAMDWLWDNTWLPGSQAFMYTDRNVDSGGMEPAPDLNMLIAPAFAWLYHQTGEVRFRDRGDQIFAGGVANGFLGNGKQFNQSYRWSFDYVKWRSMPPLR